MLTGLKLDCFLLGSRRLLRLWYAFRTTNLIVSTFVRMWHTHKDLRACVVITNTTRGFYTTHWGVLTTSRLYDEPSLGHDVEWGEIGVWVTQEEPHEEDRTTSSLAGFALAGQPFVDRLFRNA